MVFLCIKHNNKKLQSRIVYELTLTKYVIEYQNNPNIIETLKEKYNPKSKKNSVK